MNDDDDIYEAKEAAEWADMAMDDLREERDKLQAALAAQAAEIARLRDALARGVCIIAYECGYDFDLTVRWLSEQTDEHHVVHLSFDKDSLATAEAALSKIREARK